MSIDGPVEHTVRTLRSITDKGNHVPRQFSGPEDPAWVRLAGIRHPSPGIGTSLFQTESRPNVPLRHPSSAGALETLYLIKNMFQKAIQGALEDGTDL